MDVVGTVAVLRQRLNHYPHILKENQQCEKGIVTLSENIQPSCIGKGDEQQLILASDQNQAVYLVDVNSNGVAMTGNIQLISGYHKDVQQVSSLCMLNGIIYGSCRGQPGGLLKVENGIMFLTLLNETEACSLCSAVTVYKEGIAFTDSGNHQVKQLTIQDHHVHVLAGTGSKSNKDGKVQHAEFCQPMGLVCELDTNLYISVTHNLNVSKSFLL